MNECISDRSRRSEGNQCSYCTSPVIAGKPAVAGFCKNEPLHQVLLIPFLATTLFIPKKENEFSQKSIFFLIFRMNLFKNETIFKIQRMIYCVFITLCHYFCVFTINSSHHEFVLFSKRKRDYSSLRTDCQVHHRIRSS